MIDATTEHINRIQLYFLGTTQIIRDGQAVPFNHAKGKALLAYLALTRVAHTRPHLAALFWGESSEAAARKNLRNTLWAIRKTIDADILVDGDEERLALAKDVWVDVLAFEGVADMQQPTAAWQNLLNLYQGELLADLYFREAPTFEQWLLIERERLARLYGQTLNVLLVAYQAERRWEAIITVATQALHHDLLQETFHRALIEAYGHLGRRAEALQQYETLTQMLRHELGVAPTAETEQLAALIARGELTTIIQPQPSPKYIQRSEEETLPFIGQQAAVAKLDAAWKAAAHQTQIALISGEMGMGKSRLWAHWASRQRPPTIMSTSCLPATHQIPFFPIIDLLRSEPYMGMLFEGASPVPAVWLAEMSRLLPELQTKQPNLPEVSPLTLSEDRLRVFKALTECLLTLPQPALLFIDDIHWLDQATLDWLAYLVYQLRERPFLLVLAYRPSEIFPALQTQFSNWFRHGITTRIMLDGLSDQEAGQLIQHINPAVSNPQIIQTRGAGNPYYLIELSQVPEGDIPQTLTDLLLNRLAQLTDLERQVLETAAILTPFTEFESLHRVSGRSEEELLPALEGLLSRHILQETGARYTFVHPLLAEVTQQQMSQTRQRILHRRSAEVLEQYQPHKEAALYLADHYTLSGSQERAAALAEEAGDTAVSMAALHEACSFYQAAVSHQTTAERWQKLGRVQQLLGELEAARTSYRQAIALYQTQKEATGSVITLEIELAESFIQSGQPDIAYDIARNLVASLSESTPPVQHAKSHLVLGSALLRNGMALETAAHQFEAAFRIAHTHKLFDLAAYGRFEQGNILALQGQFQQGRERFEEATQLAQAGNDQYMRILAHNNLAYHAILAEQLDIAHRFVTTGLALADEHNLQLPLQYLYSTRGELALAHGRFDEAEQWFQQGIEVARLCQNQGQVANYQANFGWVAHKRQTPGEALDWFDQAVTTLGSLKAPYLRLQITLWRAAVFLQQKQMPEARQLLTQVRPVLLTTPQTHLIRQFEDLEQGMGA